MSREEPKRNIPTAIPKPTALPPPVTTVEEIGEQAAAVGASAGKRSRRRTGRLATRYTSPGFMVPAPVGRAVLKTKLG
jgi:hypothetical protein